LKTFFTAFAEKALRTILTVAVFHKIVFIALGAFYFAVLFHVTWISPILAMLNLFFAIERKAVNILRQLQD
jgi:hypothetical protein